MFLSRWRFIFIRCNIKTFTAAFKQLLLCGAVVFGAWSDAVAGFERVVHSPTLWGKGLATAASRNAEAVMLNPASAAEMQSFQASVFYSPSPFNLPQLSNGGITVVAPFSSFVTGVSALSSGFSLYREFTGTATIAKSFFGTLDVGANISVNHLSIARYGSTAAFSFDVGASLEIVNDLRWGFSLLNCTRSTIGSTHDPLPQIYLTGFEYTVMSRAAVAADLVKDVRYPFSIRAGTQFSPHEILDIRFGVSSAPSRYYAGFGVRVLSLYVDYSVATHAELGLTHDIGIAFQF
jgi:hypothetical protein